MMKTSEDRDTDLPAFAFVSEPQRVTLFSEQALLMSDDL